MFPARTSLHAAGGTWAILEVFTRVALQGGGCRASGQDPPRESPAAEEFDSPADADATDSTIDFTDNQFTR